MPRKEAHHAWGGFLVAGSRYCAVALRGDGFRSRTRVTAFRSLVLRPERIDASDKLIARVRWNAVG